MWVLTCPWGVFQYGETSFGDQSTPMIVLLANRSHPDPPQMLYKVTLRKTCPSSFPPPVVPPSTSLRSRHKSRLLMTSARSSRNFWRRESTSPISPPGHHPSVPESPLAPTDGSSTEAEKYSPSPLLESPPQAFRTSDLVSLSSLDGVPKPRIQQLSTTRLLMAHIGAALTLFLATTDATIVSTSLPTITSELRATHDQYTWVGVAYMLTQTACQPLYGRFSDIVGRKNVLWTSMTIFGIGSLLSGAAKSIVWLIVARGIAGIGGGGIVSSVWVITSEIVDVRHRAKWSQALSVTWSCSAIAGPLLGGVFSTASSESSTLSWRWGFYMNIPIALFGFITLLLSLHDVSLGSPCDASWRTLCRGFDFAGLLFFMSGTSSIVIGFSFATYHGWLTPSTLIPIILGLMILVCGGVYEAHTDRDALFPATSFSDLTIVIILIVTFLHNFAFSSGTFYLALYFQVVNGETPLQAGVRVLPYSLGSSLASLPVAWFIGFWQKRSHDTRGQKAVICVGLTISTLGFGLMTLLHEQSSSMMQILYPLTAGIGLGMLFHAPYQIFIKALEPRELAMGTSAFFLVRFTGATIGLAVAGTIFYGNLASRLPPDQAYGPTMEMGHINSIQPSSLRSEVIRAVSASVQLIWDVCCPCLGLALVISAFLRIVSIEDKHELSSEKKATE